VLFSFTDKNLGSELLAVGERFISRGVYLRISAASLWPGRGVTTAIPNPVVKPWLVGIAQLSISY